MGESEYGWKRLSLWRTSCDLADGGSAVFQPRIFVRVAYVLLVSSRLCTATSSCRAMASNFDRRDCDQWADAKLERHLESRVKDRLLAERQMHLARTATAVDRSACSMLQL